MLIPTIKHELLALPRPFKRVLAICFDIFACVLSVWLAFGLRLDQWGVLVGPQLLPVLFSTGLSLPLFIKFGLYRAIFRYIEHAAFYLMGVTFLIYSLLFFFIFTLIGIDGVPRSIGVIQPILLFFLISTSRYIVRNWLGENSPHHGSKRSGPIALIYGAGLKGRQLAVALDATKEVQVKGFIDDNKHLQGNTINGIPVYGDKNLKQLIINLQISDILLALPLESQSRRAEIIRALEGCRVRVRTLPGLLDMVVQRFNTYDLHDLDMNDLLGREVVPPNLSLLKKNICNKVVLVTGAGGSIGSELCRQIMYLSPKAIILIEHSEHALYVVYEDLKKISAQQDCIEDTAEPAPDLSSERYTKIRLIPYLASVRDKNLMLKIFQESQPEIVFHAAAYKHVPLVEQNPAEGILNNVFGTLICAQISLDFGVSHFILISSDKAVRPTSVMGATKRISELVLQALSDRKSIDGSRTMFAMVRFGNVLGSSGSVIPLFSAQIKAGGPITLTHTEVTRYFMTIPEAAQLVIQASSMAVGGEVFVLDMGAPIRIYDLACKMIHLSGLVLKDASNPYGDIEIKTIGLRHGEKLFEELLIGEDPKTTSHPKIMMAHEQFISWPELLIKLENLKLAIAESNDVLIHDIIKDLVLEYKLEIDNIVSSS